MKTKRQEQLGTGIRSVQRLRARLLMLLALFLMSSQWTMTYGYRSTPDKTITRNGFTFAIYNTTPYKYYAGIAPSIFYEGTEDNPINGGFNTTDRSVSDYMETTQVAVLIGCTNSGSVSIPETVLDGYYKPVIALGENLFKENTTVTSVTIPTTVRIIEHDAFYRANSIENLTLQSGYNTQKPLFCYYSGTEDNRRFGAFSYMTGLKKTTIGRDLKCGKRWDYAPFTHNNHAGSEFVIDRYVTSIPEGCFVTSTASKITIQYSTSPTRLVMSPHTFEGANIGTLELQRDITVNKADGTFSPFYGKNIKNIILSSQFSDFEFDYLNEDGTTTKSGTALFSNCTYLESIDFSKAPQITNIPDNAFAGITTLNSVTFSRYIKSIGRAAFAGCSQLSTINLSTATYLESIATNAFYNTFLKVLNLKGTKISNDNFQELVKNARRMEELYLPESALSTPNEEFANLRVLDMTQATALTTIQGKYNSTGLTELTIPQSVRVIADEVFKGCENLTIVTFETNSSLEQIGKHAFENCKKLSSFAIAGNTSNFDGMDNLAVIDDYAFCGCRALSNATFSSPTNITTLGEYALAGTGITELDFSGMNNLTKVSNGLLADSKIAALTLPTRITAIGDYAYSGTMLESITIPSTVRTIGTGAFSNCRQLASADLSSCSWMTELTPQLFKGCNVLSAVTMPASISKLGSECFRGCKAITRANDFLPASVKTIGIAAFADCSNMTTADLNRFQLSAIPDSMFCGCTKLESYSFPTSVTSIGAYAFERCKAITTFDFTTYPNITSIGSHAFAFSSMERIVLPDNVTSIGESAFYFCNKLESITIGTSNSKLASLERGIAEECVNLKEVNFVNATEITEIKSSAFAYCTSLEKFGFEGLPNLEKVRYHAFFETGLTSVTLPDNVQTVGEEAFGNCPNLQTLQFGTASSKISAISPAIFAGSPVENIKFSNATMLTEIPDEAFKDCSIKFFDFASLPNLTTIGYRAFYNSGLTDVVLGDNVTTIGLQAFVNCLSLNSMQFGVENCKISNISISFFEHTPITKVTFKNATLLTAIPSSLFYNVATLTTFDFASIINLREIGESAFKGTGLTDVVLGDNVTTIGKEAFARCLSLNSVQFGVESSKITNIADDIFEGSPAPKVTFKNATLFTTIPARMFENYTFTSFDFSSIPNLEKIGYAAFRGCTNLQNFTLPSKLNTIGSNAFEGCTSITSVTIPDEVMFVYGEAFYNCSNLASLTFGTKNNKLVSLENQAFAGCPLTEIRFYSTFENWGNISESIETTIFDSNVYANTRLTFGAAPTIKVRNAKVWRKFKNIIGMEKVYGLTVCPGLTDCQVHFYSLPEYSYNIKEDFGIHNITGAVLVSGSATGDIVLPDSINGYPVVGIAKNIFYDNSKVTSISFPGTLRMIENNAVEKMSNLKKVVFRDQLFPRGEKCYIGYSVYTVIDEEAFYECDKLEEVSIGMDIDWYEGEDEPFEDRKNLKTIRITPGCHEFGKDSGSNTYLFNYCDGIKNLIIEDSEEMLYFRKYSFQDRGIKWNFTIEPDYLYLGRTVDENCMKDNDYSPFYNWSINKLVVGDYVQYISKWLFYNCEEIGIEQLGKNIKDIGFEAFGDNSAGVRITLSPDCYCPNLERIGEGAFYGADLYDAVFHSFWFDPNNPSESKLKRVETEGLHFGTVLYDRIYLPATIEYLGRRAFSNRANNIRSIYFYPNLHEKTVEISSEVYSDIVEYGGRPLEIVCHTVCANSDMGMCGFPERKTLDFNQTTVHQTTFEYDLHVTESKKGSTLQSDGLYHEVCNACGTDDGRSEKTGNYYIHNWNGTNDIMIHKDGSSYSYAGPLAIDDSKPFQSPVNFSAESVTYNRTVTGGRVATFVLPFASNASDVNGTVYKFREFKDSKFYFDEQTGALDANTPYLVVVNEDGALLNSVDATSLAATVSTTLSPLACNVTDGTAEHVGSFVQQTLADGDNGKSYYGYASTDGAFVKAKTATLNPFRTMFTLPQASQVKRVTLQLGDDEDTPTGIIQVDADLLNGDGSPMYDLKGNIITAPVRGQIYIQNGRKILNK